MSKRVIAYLLSVVFCIGIISSCSKGVEEPPASGEVTSPVELRVPKEYEYRDEYEILSEIEAGFNPSIAFCEDYCAMVQIVETEESLLANNDYFDFESTVHVPCDEEGNPVVSNKSLVVYNYDGELLTEVSLNDLEEYIYKNPYVCIDSSLNIHVVLEVRTPNIDEYRYMDYVFDSSGNIISQTELNLDSNYSIWAAAIDDNGFLYLRGEDESYMSYIIKLDSDGNLVAVDTAAGNNCRDIMTIDGITYGRLMRFTDDGFASMFVTMDDIFAGNIETDYVLENIDGYFVPGTNGFFYNISEDRRIYFYNFADNASTQIIDLNQYYGVFGISDFYVNEDNCLISLGTDGISTDRYLCKYIPIEDGYVDERDVLVIGGVGITNDPIITNMIFRFNLTHDDIRAEIFNYDPAVYGENPEELLTEFFFEVNNGEAPDILLDFPFDSIPGQDYLVNLNDYMNRDIDLSSYNSTLINTNHDNYYLPAAYTVKGLLTFDENAGLLNTFEDFYNLDNMYSGNTYSAILGNIEHQTLLRNMMELNLPQFFNTTTHEISFDSSEFVELLEWVNYVGNTNIITEEYEMYLISDEYAMFDFYSMFDKMGVLTGEIWEYNRPAQVVGYPSSEGPVLGFSPLYNLGINQNCENQDNAWEFIRSILDYDMQRVFSRVNYAANTDANIDGFEESWNSYLLTGTINTESHNYEDELSEQLAIMNSGNAVVATIDPQIFAVIREESESYFSGDKSAEEVAGLIQNRALTIMNERY